MTETNLSTAHKLTIDVAIEALEFLKEVSNATNTAIVALTRADLEQFIKREARTKNPASLTGWKRELKME